MNIKKIENSEGTGFYSLIEVGEYEYVNPIQKMQEVYINWHIDFEKTLLSSIPEKIFTPKEITNPEAIIAKILTQNALMSWEQRLKEIMSEELPENLQTILLSNKKKDQIRLFNDIVLTPDMLMAFIFTAWKKFGFSSSTYEAHHLPNGIDDTNMPLLAYNNINDQTLDTVGDHEFTDRQLKAIINDRKVLIAKFLDRGSDWHCFFHTYNSIGAKEKGEMPHMHYISSAWGIPRADVVAGLKMKPYRMPSTVHIKYERTH